jgi:hypothetical protein
VADTDPFSLPWGIATIELSANEHRIGMHVFAHDLSGPESVARAIRFAVARARWFSLQLPAGFAQWVVFDDRGQSLPQGARAEIREALSAVFATVAFHTEGLPKPGPS